MINSNTMNIPPKAGARWPPAVAGQPGRVFCRHPAGKDDPVSSAARMLGKRSV